MKIVTTLEGEVLENKWEDLKRAYARVAEEKSGIMPTESFLIQNAKNPTTWRIISIWKDMETLDTMRASGATPAGVLIFEAADSKPSLSIFQVQSEI
jgi:quinol monooxygenase YgiN